MGLTQTNAGQPYPGKISPFGDAIVSEQTIEISLTAQWGPNSLREEITESNGATYARDNAEIKLDTGTTASAVAESQSTEILNYQPSAFAQGSGFFRRDPNTSPDTDQAIYWGVGSSTTDDGLFFKWTSSGITCVRVKNGTEHDLFNADSDSIWSGSSAPPVSDLDSGRIWFIEFSYYGAGPVRFGTFKRDKVLPTYRTDIEELYLAYDPQKDTTVDSPYINTGNFRWIVRGENGGNAPSTTTTVFVGDRQASLFGKRKKLQRALWDKTATISIGTSRTPLIAFRPVIPFRGRPNNVEIRIEGIYAINEGSNDIEFEAAIFDRSDVTADQWDASQHTTSTSAVEAAENSDNLSTSLSNAIIRGIQPFIWASGGQSQNDTTVQQGQQIQSLGRNQVFVAFGTASGGATDARVVIPRREGW